MNDETMMGVIHSSYHPSVVTTNIHYWSRVSSGWEPGESVWMIPNPPTYQGTRQPLFVGLPSTLLEAYFNLVRKWNMGVYVMKGLMGDDFVWVYVSLIYSMVDLNSKNYLPSTYSEDCDVIRLTGGFVE